MRFSAISIKNYRQYRDIKVEFKQVKDTDLHIIVASNGVGKTNLLNAINFCLYDDEPHLNDDKDSLPKCNNTARNEARRAGETYVDVTVTIHAENGSDKLIFDRTLHYNAKTDFEGESIFKVTIMRASGTDILEGEQADEYVNTYLPKKIREYFFFDGERLDKYFDKDKNTAPIKDSIHEIAQINIITSGRKHLQAIIDELRREAAKYAPDIERLERQLQERIKAQEAKETDIDSVNAAIRTSKDKIAELTGYISNQENAAIIDKDLNEVNTRIVNLRSQEGELNIRMLEFIRKYYQLLATYDINKVVSEYIDAKAKNGQLPPDIDIGLLRRSLESHVCAVCEQDITNNSEEHINHLIQRITISSAVSNKLMEVKNDVNEAVGRVQDYQSDKKELFDKQKRLKSEIEALESRAVELRKRLAGYSDVTSITKWVNERTEHQELLEKNTKKLGSYEEQLIALKEEVNRAEEELNKAIAAQGHGDELLEKIKFASEAKDILEQIEQEITTEVRRRMETETMEVFERLIWKKNTYGNISLSEDYKLRLYHKITGESCLGSGSASERELLALAFTIALHKVSGHDALLFIDTPVGRVSDVNREKFAQALIDVSKSKQLILAFTPSEFSSEIQEYFRDEVLSSKVYFSNPSEETTQIERK